MRLSVRRLLILLFPVISLCYFPPVHQTFEGLINKNDVAVSFVRFIQIRINLISRKFESCVIKFNIK